MFLPLTYFAHMSRPIVPIYRRHFVSVDNADAPVAEFQDAIIRAVGAVTHIAPPDSSGKIIAEAAVADGVIRIPIRKLGLCAGVTNARFTTTTEVYPDSEKATAEECNRAQVCI